MKHRSTDVFLQDAENEDFIVRKRRPGIWQIPLLFVIVFAVIYFSAESIDNTTSKLTFIATLAVVIGALSWFVVWFTQRNRDMLLVTEFQNALFASAASLASRFCMIARRDGTIVYFDPGFQKVFAEFVRKDLRTIDALLEHEKVDKHAMHTVLSTMENDTSARTIIPITTAEGHRISMMVTIDALPRPKGYFLFRGREYVERRKENVADGRNILQHMANNLPLGVYVLSPEGDVEFVNRTLESWLGYRSGEIVESGLKISDILDADNDIVASGNDRGDYEADVILRCRNGKPVRFHVIQQVISFDGDSARGVTGIVTVADDENMLKKKAL